MQLATPTPVMKVNGCEGELVVVVGHQAGRQGGGGELRVRDGTSRLVRPET